MGVLKLAVLSQLSRRALSGYALIQALRQDAGWTPSPGSVYPLLNGLVRDGLATVRAHGRRKVYTLTRHGISALEELRGQSRGRFEQLASQLRVCSPEPRADKGSLQILERLSKGEAPFGWLTSEMEEVRRLAMAVGARELDPTRRLRIRRAVDALARALRGAKEL